MNKYLEKLAKNTKNPIVFDYDGVLFEARWYKERINMPGETDELLLAAMERGENLETKPMPFMVEWVKTLENPLFVLSHMHNDLEYNFKKSQIQKYYPSIPLDRVLMAKSPEDKIRYLEKIGKDIGGNVIYIDDTHPALIKFENYFDDTYKFFHVSSLYV